MRNIQFIGDFHLGSKLCNEETIDSLVVSSGYLIYSYELVNKYYPVAKFQYMILMPKVKYDILFCTASECVHYLGWSTSTADTMRWKIGFISLFWGFSLAFERLILSKSVNLVSRTEEKRLQCVPSVESFSSRISSSHFYTCRSFHPSISIYEQWTANCIWSTTKSVKYASNRQRWR